MDVPSPTLKWIVLTFALSIALLHRVSANAESGNWITIPSSEVGLQPRSLRRDPGAQLSPSVELEDLHESWSAIDLGGEPSDSSDSLTWNDWSATCRLTVSPNGYFELYPDESAKDSLLLLGIEPEELELFNPDTFADGTPILFERAFENFGLSARVRRSTDGFRQITIRLPSGASPHLIERDSDFAVRVGSLQDSFHAGTEARFLVQVKGDDGQSRAMVESSAISPAGIRYPATVVPGLGGNWQVLVQLPSQVPYSPLPWELLVRFEGEKGCRSVRYAFGVSVPFARIEPRFRPTFNDGLQLAFMVTTLNPARLQIDGAITAVDGPVKITHFAQSASVILEQGSITLFFEGDEFLGLDGESFLLHNLRLQDQETGRVLQHHATPIKFDAPERMARRIRE